MKNLVSKFLFLCFLAGIFPSLIQAQVFNSNDGHIWFFSEAPLEDITAHNYQVACALNSENGNLAFKVIMNKFEFEKDLMKKHFNENYLETEKYPHAMFKGKIENFQAGIFEGKQELEVIVSGDLTIHGVVNNIREKALLKFKNNTIEGTALFTVRLEDYKIKIPKAVIKNIAEEVDVHIEINLTPYKKN